QQWDFAAAAGGVDHIGGNRIAARVTAQSGYDLQSLLYRRTEVGRAGDRVALVQIVWPDASHQQSVHQRLHDFGIVVDALQQHGLAAERDAGIGEAVAGLGDLRGQLVGVREVDRQPHPVPAKHAREILGDSHRQDSRYLGSEANKLDVLDRPEPREQPVQLLVVDRERVTAGEENVPYLGV